MRSGLATLPLVAAAVTVIVGIDESVIAFAMGRVPICEEVCTENAECGTLCYENMMEFGNGNDINCYEYGTYDWDLFCCYDGLCRILAEENCSSCPADCGACLTSSPVCGLNGCEQGENCQNCQQDCGSCGTVGECDYDDRCEEGEDAYCQDCQFTGFCEDDEDCPDFQGGAYKYTCVRDRCVLTDLPWVSNTCNSEDDCEDGWTCHFLPNNYHGSWYTCPGSPPADECGVCIPDWVQ